MAKRVRDTGTETATASDLRPRLAMAILFLSLLVLLTLLPPFLLVDAVVVGSRLVRCFVLWESIFSATRRAKTTVEDAEEQRGGILGGQGVQLVEERESWVEGGIYVWQWWGSDGHVGGGGGEEWMVSDTRGEIIKKTRSF